MTLFEPATGEPVDQEVSLEGSGRPYVLDAWSGTITPIVHYSTRAGRVTVRIHLSRDNGALIALSDNPNRFGTAVPAVYVTRTTADDAVTSQGALMIRASKAGMYTSTLSHGRTVTSEIGDVAAPIDLTGASWHVTAEDWKPVKPYADTFGVAAAQTRKDRIDVDVNGLKPWPDIPQLQNASGLASYTTRFDLPAAWTATNGAILELGEVFDSFTVTLNGQPVTINQIGAQGDVGSYLKAGANTITVRVATTLNNRLADLDSDVANRGIVQPYGLVGPVRLTPYSQTMVWK
jgi:hypothetical protein